MMIKLMITEYVVLVRLHLMAGYAFGSPKPKNSRESWAAHVNHRRTTPPSPNERFYNIMQEKRERKKIDEKIC